MASWNEGSEWLYCPFSDADLKRDAEHYVMCHLVYLDRTDDFKQFFNLLATGPFQEFINTI